MQAKQSILPIYKHETDDPDLTSYMAYAHYFGSALDCNRPHLYCLRVKGMIKLFPAHHWIDIIADTHNDENFMKTFGLEREVKFNANMGLVRAAFHNIHCCIHATSYVTKDHAASIAELDKELLRFGQIVEKTLMSPPDGRPESERAYKRIDDLENRFSNFSKNFYDTFKAKILNDREFLNNLSSRVSDLLAENANFMRNLCESPNLKNRIDKLVEEHVIERAKEENATLMARVKDLEVKIDNMN